MHLHRYSEAAAEARHAVKLNPDAQHARTLLATLDWSYRNPMAPGPGAPSAKTSLPGGPLGALTLEIHLRTAPTPEQRTALAATVADWFAEGAAGGFGGAFRSFTEPEDDGPILRWRLDLGDAALSAMGSLVTRLSVLKDISVARMLTKRPTDWSFWQP